MNSKGMQTVAQEKAEETLSTLLGPTLSQQILKDYRTKQKVENELRVIVLYFASTWSHRNRQMLEELSREHKIDNDIGAPAPRSDLFCEVVYVGSDLDEATYDEASAQPWHMIGWESTVERRVDLMRQFDVKEIPAARFVRLADSTSLSPEESKDYLDHSQLPKAFKDVIVGTEIPLAQLSHENAKVLRETAIAKFEDGDFSSAASLYSKILASFPSDTKANYNQGVLLHTLGLSRLAVNHLIRVVEADPDDATAHSVLRSVLYDIEPELVLAELEELAERQPQNARAAHAVATIKGNVTSIDPDYVKAVFNDMSAVFDDKLVNQLQYKVPWLILEELTNVWKMEALQGSLTVLDLGCGTGLCGKLLQPYIKHITGVDLAHLMIEKARELNVYNELRAEDIQSTLQRWEENSVDLVLAADVWIYLGDLSNTVQGCAKALRPEGILAFSVESARDNTKDYQVLPSGRFGHSKQYIQRLATAHRLQIVVERDIVVRMEQAQPLPGMLYLMKKTS